MNKLRIEIVLAALVASTVVGVVRADDQPPAAVSAGQQALPFTAKTLAGTSVKFPGDYKGKVVLLDFWATWCSPCVAELPNVSAAYSKFHSQGFDVLSVSLDDDDAGKTLPAFLKKHKMTWPQIYDGKEWRAEIAVQYGIGSIPHAFLVDGDTGKIIADGENVRGKDLAPAIKKALAARAAANAIHP